MFRQPQVFSPIVKIALIILIVSGVLFSLVNQAKAGDESGGITLLEFTSSGCGACQQLKPYLNEMREKGYPIRTVSLDNPKNREVFDRYRVKSMPTLVMLLDGKEVNRCVSHGESAKEIQSKLLAMFSETIEKKRSQMAVPKPESANIRPTSAVLPVSAPNGVIPIQTADSGRNAMMAAATVPRTSSLISASVRIRIKNVSSIDYGTGTIIHVNRIQQNREALILTCGHLFRSNGGKCDIEVDVFDPASGKPITVHGACIQYDDEIDLAFVGIPLPVEIQPISPAAAEYRVKAGEHVVSVGCNGGQLPSILEHEVLSTDRNFFNPKPGSNKSSFNYIQVSKAPVGGRSGGGLFNFDGHRYHLVGVCNAGDTGTNDGFFVPGDIIFRQLASVESLRFVYNDLMGGQGVASALANAMPQNPPDVPANAVQSIPNATAIASPIQTAQAVTSSTEKSQPVQSAAAVMFDQSGSVRSVGFEEKSGANSAVDKNALLMGAALEELKKRQQAGAEIICIVNWGPSAPGEKGRETEVIRLPKEQNKAQ